MQADRRVTVVILYRHPLFGEGIAHLLSTESDLEVTSVASEDVAAVARSLAAVPDVVIFERGVPDTAVEVLRAAPDALVIDVDLNPGPTFAYHREEIRPGPADIVETIRGLTRHEPDAATASPTIALLAGVGSVHHR